MSKEMQICCHIPKETSAFVVLEEKNVYLVELPHIFLLKNECQVCTKNIERLVYWLSKNMEFNLVLRKTQVNVVKSKTY